MENSKNYPYLGRFSFPDNDEMGYVVLFSKPQTGMVVSSNITGNEIMVVGNYSENWDEDSFTYLPSNVDVKLNND